MTLRKALAVLFAALAALVFGPGAASAAVEAHILRIDPRAGMNDGSPLLTTVVEVVQLERLSDVLAPCANLRGYDETLDCWSNAIEKPNAMWKAFPFLEQKARFVARVDGAENPLSFASKIDWASATKEPNVGTAWLVALDISSGMGARYADAREVAYAFVASMRPNDIMNLILFDDRTNVYVADSKWKTFAQREDLVKILSQFTTTSPSHGQSRQLFDQIKQMTKTGFGDLGNVGGSVAVKDIPLHQAMVVLSNGAGRNDPGTTGPAGELFKQYISKGRFPDDNPLAPKTPLPIISILFPNPGGGLADSLYRGNDATFMQNLANVEIGGYFNVVRSGQGKAKAPTIVKNVRSRFDAMHIVKWRLSCLNPTAEQSFKLAFVDTNPAIKPDGTFDNVPIGMDPSRWPLDVNVAQTKAEADANPLYPGGTFRVYGNFCWGSDKGRATAYFVPAGTRPDPNASSSDPEVAKKAMATLTSQGMKSTAIDADAVSVVFQVPDDERVLEGTGDAAVTRLVIVDQKVGRASGVTEKTVLTLKAQKKPINWLLILGIAGGVVVVGLLVIVMIRGGGGGGGKRKRSAQPPAPVVAGGYGAPPGGGYGAPPGGGYGAPPGGGYGAPPPGGGYGAPPGGGQSFSPDNQAGGMVAGGVVQLRCPACGMMTMATPGQASVCFSCGQPLPADVTRGGGAVQPAQGFSFDRGHAGPARASTEPLRRPSRTAGALPR
jgi:hypothetical protein